MNGVKDTLEKEQSTCFYSTIFMYEFKMGRKPSEIFHVHHAFAPGSTCECTVEYWFHKFYVGNESFKCEESRGWISVPQPEKLMMNLEYVLKPPIIKTTKKKFVEKLNHRNCHYFLYKLIIQNCAVCIWTLCTNLSSKNI